MTDIIPQQLRDLEQMGRAARAASRQLAILPTDVKNAALLAIADRLESHAAAVLEANAADVAEARSKGLPGPGVAPARPGSV